MLIGIASAAGTPNDAIVSLKAQTTKVSRHVMIEASPSSLTSRGPARGEAVLAGEAARADALSESRFAQRQRPPCAFPYLHHPGSPGPASMGSERTPAFQC